MEKRDARKLPREAQEEIRCQAMRLREELNLTWKEVARVTGVSIGAVLSWAKRYGRDGVEGLKSRWRGRREYSGRTLSLVQEYQLRQILEGENPKQMKLPFALWNRRVVMELIEQEFGIKMPIRTVGEYLRRWGYTPQRPMKRALEQNPKQVREWREESYPGIIACAKAEDAEIYWADETAAVAEDGHWLRGYAPAGQTPVLAASTKRYGLTMISAINNQGLVRFKFIDGAMDAERMVKFMADVIEDCERKVFLIVDNLKAHHATLVTDWLEKHKDRIEVFYLPPYSPEINPDEYLNRDFKTALRLSARSESRDELLSKAKAFMESLCKLPGRVSRYFKNPNIMYISILPI